MLCLGWNTYICRHSCDMILLNLPDHGLHITYSVCLPSDTYIHIERLVWIINLIHMQSVISVCLHFPSTVRLSDVISEFYTVTKFVFFLTL
jgi:hypothetical protein